MKEFSLNRLFVLFAALAALFAISGCSTSNSSSVGESELAGTTPVAPMPADIDVIERNDTTGTVTAAREAANNLITNAKAAAAKIIADAKKLAAPEQAAIRAEFSAKVAKESKERVKELLDAALKAADAKLAAAERKSAKIISEAKKKADAQLAKIISDALESTKKSREAVVKAKGQADKIIADAKNASKKGAAIIAKAKIKAAAIIAKSKKTLEKIEKTLLTHASKSVGDILRKSLKDAAKMKSDAKKILDLAKIYSEKRKSDADIYLKNKMDEADKSAAEFQRQVEKREGVAIAADKDAKPAMADNILSGVMKGMKSGDYAAFSKNFTKDLKKNITEKNFRIMSERLKGQIGECVSRQYLGSVRKGDWIVYLWKAKYEKSKNNDLVLRLALGKYNGKLQVVVFEISNL